MGKNQHVTYKNGTWRVLGEGNNRATVTTRTKQEAVDIGRIIAKNQQSELVIHNKNGRISDKDSYGNDQCPPKDIKH